MSDLITFPLSQLARALGTVPLPGRGMGPDSTTPLSIMEKMEKWFSLPLTWYWRSGNTSGPWWAHLNHVI